MSAQPGGRARGADLPALSMIVASSCSLQGGNAIAISLARQAGTVGAVGVRLTAAALIASVVWRSGPRPPLRMVVGLGLMVCALNGTLYGALTRIPLGVAIALSFTGPLTISIVRSRRPVDVFAGVLAGLGVVLLTGVTTHADMLGIAFALLNGALFGTYIVLAGWIGNTTSSTALLRGMFCAAAAFSAPTALVFAGARVLEPSVLAIGAVVGLFSAVVPYFLELTALRRVGPRALAVTLSLDPAVSCIVGYLVLHQALDRQEVVGVALVVTASFLAVLGPRRAASVHRHRHGE
ncbi:MAG: EamA family transporter [Actinobacteria bacterium]|nr:EamA family transporter [Actinomycetota bacterium]